MLQEALATSSMYTGGDSKEVTDAIERGLQLSQYLREGRRQLHLLGDLNVFLLRRGDFSGALEVAKRGAGVAKTIGDATENAAAEWLLGSAYHLTGDQAAALHHCELGFQLVSNAGRGKTGQFGYDHRATGLNTLARSLWLSGFPDRGCKAAHEAIKAAGDYDHLVTRCIALLYSIPVLVWSGDLERASIHAEAVFGLADKYSLAPYRAVSLALKGELKVANGDAPSGVEILREGLKAMDANQYRIVKLPTSRALAEGLALSGRPEEALAVIDEVVVQAEQVAEILWLPDLLRARGEILLAQRRPDIRVAEDSLLRSIGAARKQSALSWELRAAIPLARMWGEHGRSNEARSMLEDIHRRFTEGFETRDLVAARRLLDELSSEN